MFAYRDEHGKEDALEQWLDILQSRMPGAVVLLVGTHKDLFDDSKKRERRINDFKNGACTSSWSHDGNHCIFYPVFEVVYTMFIFSPLMRIV